MQALGNDFMVINAINDTFSPSKALIQAWSHRHFGIGFDQLLVISPCRQPDHDYFYQIYNSNGEEVGQCGNGARCAAVFIHQHIEKKKLFRLKTISTHLELEILHHHQVKLRLPPPLFSPSQIPMNGFAEALYYQLPLHNELITFHAINVGNPHAVILVENPTHLASMDIQSIGSTLEKHPVFPEACNINFMSILSPNDINLRVWERGCGETLACGSGALAAAACAIKFHHCDSSIQVHLPGGKLTIQWPDINGSIEQIGPAIEVFQGKISRKLELFN